MIIYIYLNWRISSEVLIGNFYISYKKRFVKIQKKRDYLRKNARFGNKKRLLRRLRGILRFMKTFLFDVLVGNF